MNRLFILFVVLVVGSTAWGLDIWPPPIPTGELGSVTNPMFPSDEIVVLVYSDQPLIALCVILEVVSGPATIVEAISRSDCASYGWDPTLSFDPRLAPDGKEAEIGVGTFANPVTGEVAYFVLHGEGGGEITLRLVPSCFFGCSWILGGIEPTIGGEIVVYQGPAATCWDANECGGQAWGDGTCDGMIDLADLYALRRYFGRSAPWIAPECCSDYTHDNYVSLADLFMLKANFGTGGYSPATGNQNCP